MASLERRVIFLGISGTQGSGKTTLSRFIPELWPEAIHLFFAFADPIKQEVQALGIDTSVKTPFVRLALQRHGALQRTRFGADYWINQTQCHCQEAFRCLAEGVENLVIQIMDIRLPEEAAWFRTFSLGAESETRVLIRVEVPEEIRKLRLPGRQPGEALANPNDETENLIAGITPDFLIFNDSSTEDLKTRLRIVLDQVLHQLV